MKKHFLFGVFCLVGLMIFSAYEYLSFYDGKMRIVVCDVGQGDGIIIKSPEGYIMLFDAGPDDSILTCLSDNLPFWRKNLDLVMISHPHADHFMGMFSIFPHYTAKTYVSETLVNRSSGFKELQKELSNSEVLQKNVDKNDRIILPDGVRITVLGPSDEFLKRASPTGEINDSKELVSLIVLIEYGDFSVLLTGDSQVPGLEDALESSVSDLGDIVMLQIPHHGSASGLSDDVLEKINPEVATISVGKNKYGHPTEKILDLLREDRIKTYRTDLLGSITVDTDGKKHTVKSERQN